MHFRCIFCLTAAIVILMGKQSGAICYPSCPCINITNVSTICNITYNVTNRPLAWQDFFEFEVETIQKLVLILNNNFHSQPFPLQEFFQFNWHSLQELQVQNLQADDTVQFQMAYLEYLPNLTKLVLRLGETDLIAGNVQSPLRLRYLDISDNGNLNFVSLAKIINVSGTALEELYTNGINDYYDGAVLYDDFFKSFEKTNLRILHAKDSNIRSINSPNLSNFLPFLEELDVSQNNVDITWSTYDSARNFKNFKKFYCPNTIIGSFRQYKSCDNNLQARTAGKFCAPFDFILLRTLEVVSIGGSRECGDKVLCEYSKCTFPETTLIRELHLSNCCYKRFDLEIKGLHKLEMFDFSMNFCEYISPLVFSEMKSLKTLLLNGNDLSKMENSNPDEFTNLTRKNGNLMNLNLASNGLVKIPSDFFANNPKLEILDLSNNLLSVTDWLTSNLINLRVLDIRNNRLTTLDSETRNLIDSRSFITFMAKNPLDCSCEDNDLYVWLSNRNAPNVNITEVFCTKTSISLSSHINEIDSFSYECKLKRYIGFFGLFSIPVIMATCGVFYYRHYQNILRIRRIRKQIKDFVEENVAPQQKFLLYLAYSFADSETVLKHIFPELESRLQQELKVADNLVCISDRDFDVGTNISDEIIRAVSSCTAVLFVISKKFASSRWCEFESEIAIYEQKPIIVVVLEQIKIKSFPSSLRKVCYKWTRMEWPGQEDVNRLDEFWRKLTKAVIKYTDVKY